MFSVVSSSCVASATSFRVYHPSVGGGNCTDSHNNIPLLRQGCMFKTLLLLPQIQLCLVVSTTGNSATFSSCTRTFLELILYTVKTSKLTDKPLQETKTASNKWLTATSAVSPEVGLIVISTSAPPGISWIRMLKDSWSRMAALCEGAA